MTPGRKRPRAAEQQSSPLRVSACPHFPWCGGTAFLLELASKTSGTRRSKDLFTVPQPEQDVFEILPSDIRWDGPYEGFIIDELRVIPVVSGSDVKPSRIDVLDPFRKTIATPHPPAAFINSAT